jgi:hypothetical protein
MKKIYISGKVTGDPDYGSKFFEEERRLYNQGYDPVNPVRIIGAKDAAWCDAMRADLREMLLCDGVSLLPDWKESKGAQIEEKLARELGIEVRPCAEWEEVSP